MLDHRLGTVAVVDIPIDDQHALACSPHRLAREHGHMVHDAEAHRAMMQRVMTGRTDCRERVTASGERVVQGGQRGTGRPECGRPAISVECGIGTQFATAGGAHRSGTVEIAALVARQDCVQWRGRRRHDVDPRG